MSDGPREVVVLRALRLGDLLRAVPAFRAMRHAWPDATIRLIGLPGSRWLVDRLPGYLDDALEFPGWPGVPERELDQRRVATFLEEIRREPVDLAIQLHGSGRFTNAFVALLGARRTAGSYVPGAYRPDPSTFVPSDERASEVRRTLAVLEALGVAPAGEELELLVLEQDDREAAALLHGRIPPDGRYAIVHPGGRSARRWPAARFAEVADAIAGDVPVVLTGSREERAITAAVAGRMRRPVVDLAGRTSIGALFALVNGADVVVSNDTGVSHVADALGVTSVVLFTSSDPARWAPADREMHRVVHGDTTPTSDVVAHARSLLVSSRRDPVRSAG